MKRLSLALFLLIIVLNGPLYYGCVTHGDKILRLSDGTEVTLSQILDDLKGVRLVFVGELHTRKSHHMAQLAVIRALNEAGTPLAIGLEMFRRENQKDLNRWINGEIPEEAFKKVYYENWTFDWSLYRDIFLYARKQGISMLGLNVPRETTQRVARQGFDSLTPGQIGELPHVSCNVDATYMEFIRRSFGAHAHAGMDFIHFCEAQIVWDTAMAWNLLAFLRRNPDATVVVLAGNGHAWKRGIPEQIQRQSPVTYRVILPEEPGRTEQEDISSEDADYLWLKS
jgi:uncharacterized iron-regulated protein